MKILYVIPSLFSTAPNAITLSLARGMMAHGHECEVAYFDSGNDDLPVPCQSRQITFRSDIDFGHYDIVHSYGMRPNLFVTLRKKLRHKAKVRFIATCHSYIFEDFRSLFGRVKGSLLSCLFLLSLRRHDRIVVLSHDAVGYYGRWLDRRKLVCCFNGVALRQGQIPSEDHARIVAFKGDGVLLADICFLDRIKGVDILVGAMSKLPGKYRLLLIGNGDEEERLKAQALRECPGRVLFLETKPEAYRFLELIDIFVQTAWSEGFCLSMTEAAMMGRKIVSSDIPGMREKYTDAEVTYFSLQGSDEDRREALAQAVCRADASIGMAERAREKALQAFGQEQMIDRYLRIYEEME